MALCYNLIRMLTILGLAGFVAALFAQVAGLFVGVEALARDAWMQATEFAPRWLSRRPFQAFAATHA